MASTCKLARIFLNSNYIDGLQHQEKRCQHLQKSVSQILKACALLEKPVQAFQVIKYHFALAKIDMSEGTTRDTDSC